MKLEIKAKTGRLTADQPKFRLAILLALLGLVGTLGGCVLAFSIDLLIGLIITGVGCVVALWGVAMALKEELLLIYPHIKRIFRQYSYVKEPEEWDTDFLSAVEAHVIQDTNNKSFVTVFLKFKIGSEQQVLKEPGETVPQNCITYINMLLEGKEVPEGTFTD